MIMYYNVRWKIRLGGGGLLNRQFASSSLAKIIEEFTNQKTQMGVVIEKWLATSHPIYPPHGSAPGGDWGTEELPIANRIMGVGNEGLGRFTSPFPNFWHWCPSYAVYVASGLLQEECIYQCQYSRPSTGEGWYYWQILLRLRGRGFTWVSQKYDKVSNPWVL